MFLWLSFIWSACFAISCISTGQYCRLNIKGIFLMVSYDNHVTQHICPAWARVIHFLVSATILGGLHGGDDKLKQFCIQIICGLDLENGIAWHSHNTPQSLQWSFCVGSCLNVSVWLSEHSRVYWLWELLRFVVHYPIPGDQHHVNSLFSGAVEQQTHVFCPIDVADRPSAFKR